MMRIYTTHPNIKKQSGVSIVTAIFLVIVLALMGAGMVSLLTTSQQSISQEYTSAKAYMAARSCLQWGMYQTAYPQPFSSVAGRYKNTLNNNLRCDETAISFIDTDGIRFFNIQATGKFGNIQDPEYSERTMRLQFQP